MTPAGTDCEFYHCENSSFKYFSFINILCEKTKKLNGPSEKILLNYASATECAKLLSKKVSCVGNIS